MPRRCRDADTSPKAVADYTRGFGSFDFFPYPSIYLYGESCQDGFLWSESYWGRARAFYPKPRSSSYHLREAKRAPAEKMEKKHKEKNARRLKDMVLPFSSPLLLLPDELLLEVLQPMVDNLRLRPPEVYADHLPVPDKRGVNFLVSLRSKEQIIDVMVDPRLSLEPCARCKSTADAASEAPQAKCKCSRRPEDYQTIVSLSQVSPGMTQLIGEMVWKNAWVTFVCPEALLKFAQERPAAMAQVRGITLTIDLHALQGNSRKIARWDHIIDRVKPEMIQDSPLAKMLDYLRQSRRNTTAATTDTESLPPPLTFFHIILTAAYLLPDPTPTRWDGASYYFHHYYTRTVLVRPIVNPPSPSEASALLEHLLRLWAWRFHALPVRERGFKMYVLGQDRFEPNQRFCQRATEFWMPRPPFTSRAEQEENEETKSKLYEADKDAYLKGRNEGIKWLAEKKEQDAKWEVVRKTFTPRQREEHMREMEQEMIRREREEKEKQEELEFL